VPETLPQSEAEQRVQSRGISTVGISGVPNQPEIPSGILIDNVHFTLTGPQRLSPGAAHQLLFWLHVQEQSATVLALASSAHRIPTSELSVNSEGPHPLSRGTRVSVRLEVSAMRCIDSQKWVTGTGEIGRTSFIVAVLPSAVARGYPGRASIRVNGCEIARMSFLLHVGPSSSTASEIPSQTDLHRRAFASYASEDRAEVLNRVHGMEKACKGFDVFVDVINLRFRSALGTGACETYI
jgi:hypothetical protein